MFRPEFPNPQFRREHWQNLNGPWSFTLDMEDNGAEKGYFERKSFEGIIEVPFCPESRLSGIGHTDFINACWYAREIEISKSALKGRVMLHFGAVDYEATVYVNGKQAGKHRGGYTPFAVDITTLVTEGANTLVVHARDNTRDPMIPSGKQSSKTASYGCYYTRTTGIWQTVWLEFVPNAHIKSFRFYPDIHNQCVTLEAAVCGSGILCAEVSYDGKPMATETRTICGDSVRFTIPLPELHLWEPGCGRLYDVTLTYGEDAVYTYFGMREVKIEGRRVLINGKSVFQRLVLDQGFYPDGIYTAKDEQALVRDIEISLAAGFNGARLHEKVFEPLFLYHADRLGYLVWGEYPNWGLNHTDSNAFFVFYPEWAEEIERDFNHPAIIGWCPFNETWNLNGHRQDDRVLQGAYDATKALDSTRPVIDTSGNCHVKTDIYDVHNYNQDPAAFREKFAPEVLAKGELWDPNVFHKNAVHSQTVAWDGKQPLFVSEYGGIRWSALDGWGYGNAPKTEEKFLERYRGLTDAQLNNPYFFGFCYTQLYDVEQEQNGLYTYEREPKFDMSFFKEVNSRKAKIEE